MSRLIPVPAVVLVVMLAAGCAGAGMHPSATVTTTTPGVTERWFKVDWTVESDTAGARRLDGHVENVSGRPVTSVQLLIQSLDAGGNLVAQQRQWLGGDLPSGARQYFAVRRLAPAAQYRVSVWSYNAIETNGHRDRWWR